MVSARILIVEDDPFEAEKLYMDLVQDGHQVIQVLDRGDDLSNLVNRLKIDLLFVDIVLRGEMDGIEAVAQLRKTSNLPVIYLSSFDNDDFLRRAELTRPAAYMLKPYRKRELGFLVKMTLIRFEIENQLIEQRNQAEQSLWQMATHDSLTHLPNRTLLLDRIDKLIPLTKRNSHKFAIIFIDLDNFKLINDSYGHSTGDQVLMTLATRLTDGLREADTVARFGGDEFVVLSELQQQNARKSVLEIIQKITDIIARAITVQQTDLTLGCSCGIALCPDDANDADTLLRHADTAMYSAKQQPGNSHRFYSSELSEQAHQQADLEAALRKAIDHKEFELYFQPQIDLVQPRVTGVEALIRWNRPGHGLILPGSFIATAESSGLIKPITEWVLKLTCQHLNDWHKQGLDVGYVAINFSHSCIMGDESFQSCRNIIEQSECPPGKLELEFTESHLMCESPSMINWLQQLIDEGFRIAIDDFGTGYSSLSYLKQMPVSKLKIDKSFVQDLPEDCNSLAIVKTIVALGQSLGLDVTAEGVETTAQAECLQRQGCRHAQGFLYARPMPEPELLLFLDQFE